MANDQKFTVPHGVTTPTVLFASDVVNATDTISATMVTGDAVLFAGDAGQLLKISDSQIGTIFAVNDLSGITSIGVDEDGTVKLAEAFGDVLVGTRTNTSTGLLQVDGAVSAKVYHELFTVGTIAANTVSLDLNTGASVVTVSTPGANFILAIANVPNTGNTTTGIATIVSQGGVAFIPHALTVNGSAVTINWLGGSAPAGAASKTDVFAFTLINTGGTFSALGSKSSFG